MNSLFTVALFPSFTCIYILQLIGNACWNWKQNLENAKLIRGPNKLAFQNIVCAYERICRLKYIPTQDANEEDPPRSFHYQSVEFGQVWHSADVC